MKSITTKGMCLWCIFLATNGPLGAELKFRENTVSGWGGGGGGIIKFILFTVHVHVVYNKVL